MEHFLQKFNGRWLLLQSSSLLIIETDESTIRQLISMPGVERAYHTVPELVRATAEIDIENFIGVAAGIDLALASAALARYSFAPNGNFKAALGAELLELPPNFYPLYPRLDTTVSPARLYPDPDLVLNTSIGFMAALNISLGDKNVEVPFFPEDPVNILTKEASKYVPVVIAAGNSGTNAAGKETLNPWAQAPWVISVGATDSLSGGMLLPESSRGSEGNPESGPTVVAYGLYSPPNDRVAQALLQFAAFCLTLRHFVQAEAGVFEGIPLVGRGFVDEDIGVSEAERMRIQIPALPFAGINLVCLKRVLRVLDVHEVKLDLWPTPQILRQMIINSARPLPNCQPHEVGHGFVGEETVIEYLNAFTGETLVGLFHPELPLSAKQRKQLRECRLADSTLLLDMLALWSRSALRWTYDIKRPGPMQIYGVRNTSAGQA
jgi:hypothetical protein